MDASFDLHTTQPYNAKPPLFFSKALVMPDVPRPIVHVCIFNARRDYFDYYADGELPALGVRVWVPFGSKRRMGLVVGYGAASSTDFVTKTILECIDDSPIFPEHLLKLCHWVSRYYQATLAEVIPLALPKQLREGRACTPSKKTTSLPPAHQTPPLALNPEQTIAVEHISQQLGGYHCFLIDGVTGSGKTEVYLQVIEKVLETGKQVLVLVPEIGLTPQLLSRFSTRFHEPIAVMHSHLNETERRIAWQNAAAGLVRLVIGTRGAVFAPMPNLGLIVIDEEHDASFKQMDRVRYSARDTALMRAFTANIPIILGSATPSLESLHNGARNKYTRLLLTTKAVSRIPLRYQLMDMRNETLNEGIASSTLHIIREHLERQHQVLVFINRRGFSPVLLCHQCGWMADCRACDSHLTVHRHTDKLACHHCGLIQSIPRHCKACKSTELIPIGAGTQRIYDYLTTQFPTTRMLRIDRDEVQKKKALDECLDQINRGEAQLIVGTQMLAKGHHFPKLTLVVVVDADHGFYNQDFRATERLGQLLTQVAGRAGRENDAGHVVIQTHLPQHPLLNLLVQEGYGPFAASLLAQRQQASLPPYAHMAILRAQSKTMPKVLHFLHNIKQQLHGNGITLLGPAPAPLARKANHHRMQLLIQSPSRLHREQVLQQMRDVIQTHQLDRSIQWNIDVDPLELA